MISGQALNKRYRGQNGTAVAALRDVGFQIRKGEFYVLLGPSGSGKTTTLRAIAGLEHPDDGEIVMDGAPVFRSRDGICVAPEQRPIAMVFQSYALWPHMDVHENIAFPLRRGLRRVDRSQVAGRVAKAADMLNLTPYLRRPVSQLSGGQQQRVALARAIALEPRVLLMDEPLSNLDARLRAHLRVELKALTRAIGITTVYVTHDQTEAMVMGDRIAVMEAGRMLQEGSPAELYQRPKQAFVAKFLGDMNFIRASVIGHDGARYLLDAAGQRPLRAVAHGAPPAVGAAVSLGFRPEDALLSTAASAERNQIQATVAARHYVGDAQLYELQAADGPLQVRAPKQQLFEPGTCVFVDVEPDACLIFDNHTQET